MIGVVTRYVKSSHGRDHGRDRIRKPRAGKLPLFHFQLSHPQRLSAASIQLTVEPREHPLELIVRPSELIVHPSEHNSMLWASKRRKSRPDIPPQIKSSSSPARRSSVGSPRLPFAPLQSSDMPSQGPPQNIFIGRSILSPDEQQQLARQSP
jgi:hypothetical protein